MGELGRLWLLRVQWTIMRLAIIAKNIGYVAFVMHTHHLVPTRTLERGLWYRSVGLRMGIGTHRANRSPRGD